MDELQPDEVEALFPAPATPRGKKPKPGPIYQGVCKTIRALTDAKTIDPQRDGGTIAQARSLAASLDRVSGRDGRQASGIQLAAMHERLDALLERLNPAGVEDPFLDFINSLDEEVPRDGVAPAPHPEE